MNQMNMTLRQLISGLYKVANEHGYDIEVMIDTPNSDEYGVYTPRVVTTQAEGSVVVIDCAEWKCTSTTS